MWFGFHVIFLVADHIAFLCHGASLCCVERTVRGSFLLLPSILARAETVVLGSSKSHVFATSDSVFPLPLLQPRRTKLPPRSSTRPKPRWRKTVSVPCPSLLWSVRTRLTTKLLPRVSVLEGLVISGCGSGVTSSVSAE